MWIDNRFKQAICVSFVSILFGLLAGRHVYAADRSITLNDGQHIQVNMPIGQVFISKPKVAD